MAKTNPAIISLEDFTESINGCVYADSGIGKTVFAGTDNVLFLSLEGGTISAKRMGSKAKLIKINEWDDLQKAYDWLEANPDHGFDWVIIDSVTEMQKLCMVGILKAGKAENSKRDIDIPALQDWNKYYNMFDRFIAAFNDLPANILYTATVMQNENEEGMPIVMPNLRGRGTGYSISQNFCATLGFVAYLQKETEGKAQDAKTTRRLLFENMPPYFAKDRYNVFPRWVTVSDGDRQVSTLAGVRKKIQSAEVRESTAPRKAAPAVRRRVPVRK
jgi:hypothetical protein